MEFNSIDDLNKNLVIKYSDIQTVNPEIYAKCNESEYSRASHRHNSHSNSIALSFNSSEFDNLRKEFDKLNNRWKELIDKKNEILKSGVNDDVKQEFKDELSILRQKIQDFVNSNNMYKYFGVDTLKIVIGQKLLPVANPSENGVLLRELAVLRHSIANKLGYIIPNVRVVEKCEIKANSFEIFVYEQKVFTGELSGVEIQNCNCGLIIESFMNVCFEYVHKIMTKSDVLKLMELVSSHNPTLVNDLVPVFLSPIDLKHILANLIKDGISIKNIIMIFEILNDAARYTQNVDKLTEFLKKELVFGIE